MVISGSGQPSKLIDLIAVSQLVCPQPARRIIGVDTVDGVSHFLILRPGFSSNHPDPSWRQGFKEGLA